jgi:hypothetical protein
VNKLLQRRLRVALSVVSLFFTATTSALLPTSVIVRCISQRRLIRRDLRRRGVILLSRLQRFEIALHRALTGLELTGDGLGEIGIRGLDRAASAF